MAISSLERLVGTRVLAGLVEVFAAEEAMNRAASSKFQASARKIEPLLDGSFEWDEVQFPRHIAPVVGAESPAVAVTPLGLITRNSAPAHARISHWIPGAKLFGQRGAGELLPNAAATIDREIRGGVKLLGNLKEYLAMRALFGSVVVSNATIPGTKVPFTLSFGLNTYTATDDWSLSTARIVDSELTALRLDYMQAMGLNLSQVITGATIGDYLRRNSGIVNLLAPMLGRQLVESAGELFSRAAVAGIRFGDMDWQLTEEGYVPEGGSFTRYIPATDKFVAMPADGLLGDVLGQCEGFGLVPKNMDVIPADGSSAAASMGPAPSRGNYAYALMTLDPLGVKIVQGWCGIYVILTPNGLIVCDVVP